jgi:hypothetical protein
MMSYDACDASPAALRRLQSLAPDPRRADCVRMRCRAQLGRSQKRQARGDLVVECARRVLALAVSAAFVTLTRWSLVLWQTTRAR